MLSKLKDLLSSGQTTKTAQTEAWQAHRDWPAADINEFIVSFPKCGRTWLRVLLGAALAKAQGESVESTVSAWLDGDIVHIGDKNVMYTHAFAPRPLLPVEAMQYFADYLQDKRKVFIARDPRDTVVSYYFQRIKRRQDNPGTMPTEIGAFVRDPHVGIERIITFFNIWAEELRRSEEALLVSYEDLHYQPHETLEAILEFFTGKKFEREILEFAVDFAAFENMRKMEAGQHFVASDRLRAADVNDPQSYKTREGKIGSYEKYLSPADVEFMNERISAMLHPDMGYQKPGVPPESRRYS